MLRVGGIINHPATISTEDFEMIIAPTRGRDECSIILRASAKVAAVTLRHVHVVIHCDREAFAPIGPCQATIVTNIEAAVVSVVHAARTSGWHQKMVMIRVRVITFSPI